jgi:hypothetical protein
VWAALALLIGVIGGVVLTTVAGARRTDTAYPRFERASNAADVLVSPNSGLQSGVLEALGHLRGVAQSARVVVLFADFRVARGDVATPPAGQPPQQYFAAGGLDDAIVISMSRPNILAGRVFDPRQADEVLIDPAIARAQNLKPGDRLTLFARALGPKQSGNFPGPAARFRLKVAGIAVFDTRVVPITTADERPWLIFTPAFVHRLDPAFIGASGAYLRVRPGTNVARLEEQVHTLATRFPALNQGYLFFSNLAADRTAVQRAIHPEAVALEMFALVIGLVAVAVLGQLLSRQVVLDADDDPMLHALGMLRSELVVLALVRVAAIAVVGGLVAVAVAFFASPLMPVGAARLAEPSPGLEFNAAVLLFGLVAIAVVAVVVVAPASWRSATRVGAEPTIRGSTSASPIGAARVSSVSAPSVTAELGVRMALSPGRGRSAVPVRAAAMSTTVALVALVGALVFGANLDRLVGTPSLYGKRWDLAFQSFGAFPERMVGSVIGHIGQAQGYSAGAYGEVSIGGQVVSAVGLDRFRGDVAPVILRGRYPDRPDEIVLGGRTLARTHLRVGETAAIGVRGRLQPMRIVGQAVFPRLGPPGSFTPTDLGDGALTVASVFAPPASIGGGLGYNVVLVALRPGADVHLASAQFTEGLLAAGCPSPASCPVTASQEPGDIANYGAIRGIVSPLLVGAFALLFVATLGHVLMTSLLRRRRDFAVLRSLGFVGPQLSGILRWQASVFSVIAVVVGVPVGIAVGRLVWTAFAGSIGVSPATWIPDGGMVLTALAVVVVANALSTAPARVARRLNPGAVLRSE